MFWGSFSYNHKGPIHCWKPKISKEKKETKEDLAKLNKKLEPYLKAE